MLKGERLTEFDQNELFGTEEYSLTIFYLVYYLKSNCHVHHPQLECPVSFGYFSTVCLEISLHSGYIIDGKEKLFFHVFLAFVLGK